jgi:hypothetical protein
MAGVIHGFDVVNLTLNMRLQVSECKTIGDLGESSPVKLF